MGITHIVRPGENLWRIAQAYGLDAAELALVNGIRDPAQIAAGTGLFIPGALLAVDVPLMTDGGASPALPPPRPGRLAWPLSGVLYARFGKRGAEFHDGIDIAAPEGTAVVAAAAGTVLFAGDQRGYGQIVIVEHDGGLVTVYAHNRANLVRAGDRIAAGQPVAKVGQSGQTTGPHLHFEVRDGGRPKDPLAYLPRPR